MAKRKSSQIITPSEQRFAAAVRSAGVPADQLTNFLRAGYVPQPKQLQFHGACRLADQADGPDQIGFGGARGPGKSHAVFSQIALDDCQRIPGLKVLFIRKISKNAREQFEDLRRVILKNTPHEYARQGGVISFPNGSRIIIGHFRNESDVDLYLGLEYDIIAIEEATTLTLSKFKTLRDSNRTSKPGFRPRIYSSTNPGNVGHVWYKERFITPARRGEERETRFIFATVSDNKLIDAGYKTKLEDNTGWKLAAYRFGDWDIAAGQYFSTWNHEAHACPPMRELPRHWPIWGAFDYGFTHPTAFYLLTEFDGTIYAIAEHVEAKALPVHHAAAIRRMVERYDRDLEHLPIFAGPDVFANKGDENAKTIAQQYAGLGVHLTAAPNDRVSGWSEILDLLGDPTRPENPIAPRLQISSDCVRLIECLPALQHNPHRPEDVLKWDVDEEGSGGDDPADALRYGVMARLVEEDDDPLIGGERAGLIVR